MLAICGLQCFARDLMNADQEFGRVGGAEHFFDESVNFRVAIGIDVGEPLFLFVQALSKEPGGVGVIENVPSDFELHFEFRNAEGPCAERLHETPFEIKEAEQATRVFFDRELASELATIAREAIRIRSRSFGSGGALFGPGDSWNRFGSVPVRTGLGACAHSRLKVEPTVPPAYARM